MTTNFERLQSILTTAKALLGRTDLNQLPIQKTLKQIDDDLDDCLDVEGED